MLLSMAVPDVNLQPHPPGGFSPTFPSTVYLRHAKNISLMTTAGETFRIPAAQSPIFPSGVIPFFAKNRTRSKIIN